MNLIAKVLTRDIIRKNDLSVATKVAIQVATKIGAEPWHIDSFIQNVSFFLLLFEGFGLRI